LVCQIVASKENSEERMSRIENDIRETKNDMRKENGGWQMKATDQINKEAERIQMCAG
jgi:hypothetical protein